MLKDLTIKRKLIAILMLTSTIAILCVGTTMSIFNYTKQRQEMVDDLIMLAEVTGHNCRAPLAFDVPEDAEIVISALSAKPSIVYAAILNTEGKVFASYGSPIENEIFIPQVPLERGYQFSKSYLRVSHQIKLNGKVMGIVYLRGDLREIQAGLRRDTGIVILMLFIALAVALLLSTKLQTLISRPILALADLAHVVTNEQDYSIRAKKNTGDEVGLLVDSFNAMLAQIEHRDEALRQSAEKYRAVVEDQTELICRTLPDGTITFVNQAYCRYFNKNLDELVGQNYLPLIPREDQTKLEAHLTTITENSPVGNIEYKVIAPSGELRWFRWTYRALFDEQGIPIEFQSVGRDITERKKAEEEAQRLRRLLKNMIDSMPSSLVAVDADGCVTHWNRQAEMTTGVTPDKAEGQPLDQVFSAMKAQMIQVREAIQQRQTKSVEKVESFSNGEKHLNNVMIYPLETNGIEGAVIRVDDVTERVRLEEMMIQSEKMMSVGGLAAGMAHEINNPLSGIMQNIQVVMDRISTDLPANVDAARSCGISLTALTAYMEQRNIIDMLQTVQSSAQRAAKIVENMLSFSRKGDTEKSPHNLTGLLDNTVELVGSDYDLKKKYDFKQIEIIREYEREMPKVLCEASKIQQVFLNLLKNGAQAMAENPDHSTLPRFVLRIRKEKNMARVEVEDTGPGMNDEVRKRLFEPFFTTKDVGAGTGLGLSVSYFIVTENHGGTMSVESSLGVGSNFIIRLPLAGNA